MIYKIMLGLISVIFGYFVYEESTLTDPIRTLATAVFLALAAAVFLDTGSDNEDLENE